jgi:hypothetical protein
VIELIDSHAHVDGPEFDGDRAAVMARARAAGVRRMIVIGAVGDPGSADARGGDGRAPIPTSSRPSRPTPTTSTS